MPTSKQDQSILCIKKAIWRAPILVCSVRVCVNVRFVASGWAWPCGPMLHLWAWDQWDDHAQARRDDRWACPPCCVTFAPHQVSQGAWQEVKGEAIAVNEAAYSGVIVWTVGPEER